MEHVGSALLTSAFLCSHFPQSGNIADAVGDGIAGEAEVLGDVVTQRMCLPVKPT